MTFQAIVVLVPTIIGLTGIFTSKGLVPKKFAPLLVLFFGIALSVLFSGAKVSAEVILSGAATAVMAMGLYSGTKTTAQIFKSEVINPAPTE